VLLDQQEDGDNSYGDSSNFSASAPGGIRFSIPVSHAAEETRELRPKRAYQADKPDLEKKR
jgi:hypothetical protein